MAERLQFVVLPRRQPRWIFPRDAAGAAHVFELTPALGLVPQIVARVGHAALRRRLPAAVVSHFAEPAEARTVRRLEWARDVIAITVGDPAISVVASTGLGKAFPKMVLAAVDRSGAVCAFAKLAHSKPTVERLRYERCVVQTLRTADLGDRVPTVLAFVEEPHEALLVLSKLAGQRLPSKAPLTSEGLDLLDSIMSVPDSGWDTSERLSERLPSLTTERCRVPAALIERIALESENELAPELRCFAHGDFTPWNCVVGDAIRVTDWESAAMRPMLWDFFHYVTQIQALAGRASVTKAARNLCDDSVARTALALLRRRQPRTTTADVRRLQRWYLVDTLIERLTYPGTGGERATGVRLAALDLLGER